MFVRRAAAMMVMRVVAVITQPQLVLVVMPMGAVPEMSSSSWKSRFGSRRQSKDHSLQSEESPEASLSSSRRNIASKKGMRGRFSRLLPASHHSQSKLNSSDREHSPTPEDHVVPKGDSPETKSSSSASQEVFEVEHTVVRASSRVRKQGANCIRRTSVIIIVLPCLYRCLYSLFYLALQKQSLFDTPQIDTTREPNENQVPDDHEEMQEKRKMKERDGFCRRVDSYDGQVVVVDGTYYY